MARQPEHEYFVILAGGSGTRMWPLSRRNKPKQFQPLLGEESMLQAMYRLLRAMQPADHIFVQTDRAFGEPVREQLPELPAESLLLEPEARDTAAAFGLATACILERDPQARIGIFYADHLIDTPDRFERAVETAFEANADYPDRMVTIGITPAYAHTGLGYIRCGERAASYGSGEALSVARFVEKPDAPTAEAYVESGEYLWNTGYKVFSGEYLFAALEKIDAAMAGTLRRIAALRGKPGSDEEIPGLYGRLPRNSVEYVITEHLRDLLVVPSDMGWSDVGDLKSLHDTCAALTRNGMVSRGAHVDVNSTNCMVHAGDRLIATVGLNDIIIIDTGDVVLVADRESAQDVKQVVRLLEQQQQLQYL